MQLGVIFLLAGIVLVSCPMLASLVLLVARRYQQPIQYRGICLLFVSGVCMYVAWLWHMLFLLYEVDGGSGADDTHKPAGAREYFCGDLQWILWIANCVIIAGYVLRSYRILKIFHDHSSWTSPLLLSQQLNSEGPHAPALSNTAGLSLGNPMLSPSNGGMAISGTHSRKLDSRVYTEKYMLKLLVALLTVLVGVKIGLDYSSHPVVFSGYGCHNAEVWGWLGVNVAEIFLLVFAIWRLRTVRDDYGISAELTTVCVIWTLSTLAFGVSIFLRRAEDDSWYSGRALGFEGYMEFQTSVWAVRAFAVFFTSISWPLIQSYYNSFPPLWSNCDALCSLETLLKDIVCIQYFRNYLLSVNRVEYILAWVEMELLKDLDEDDGELIGAQARRIYSKYIQLGSELEVHLSPSIVHMVTRDVHVGTPQVTCFDDAQRELFQLMEAEFPRFLSSASCEACLYELEKEEVLREVLFRSGMIM